MFRFMAVIIALLLSLAAAASLSAQGVENPYADLPQARTEDGAFVLGSPDARFRLIEFSDFLCGYCQEYEANVAEFIQEYVLTGEAQYAYRMFPVVDADLSSLSAGLAECADDLSPGGFWLARDVMFDMASSDGFTADSPAAFADRLGLNHGQLMECAAEARQYERDQQYGFEMGVLGAPSLYVQYDDDAPMAIALTLPEHFPALVDALRPASTEAVVIEEGPYAGISNFRRADGGFVLGEPEAPLRIVAFEDFLCPYCQSYQDTVRGFIEAQARTGMAQFEFRFYPFVNPEHSVRTARIAECVGFLDIGKFWDAHDLLFELASSGRIGVDNARYVAEKLDIDMEALDDCMGRAIQFLVDMQLGDSLGVAGTPAIRASREGGALDVIYVGEQALNRGAVPLEILNALAEEAPGVSVGPMARSLLNDGFLQDSSIITGEPCGPPCWQMIRPGATSMEEAERILGSLAEISVVGVTDESAVFAFGGGEACCEIVANDEGIAETILIQLAPTNLLGDAIASLGEPGYVAGIPVSESESLLILIYPELGAFLYVAAEDNAPIHDSSPIVTAVYTTEEQARYVLESQNLREWQGYMSFDAYMGGE